VGVERVLVFAETATPGEPSCAQNVSRFGSDPNMQANHNVPIALTGDHDTCDAWVRIWERGVGGGWLCTLVSAAIDGFDLTLTCYYAYATIR
jgi:hypothetical protein